jgi:MoxR-like ATPase
MATLHYVWDNQEYTVQLDGPTTIGRAEDNSMFIPADSLSRHHAIVTSSRDAYYVLDRGSSNGISYQGKTLQSLELKDGCQFKLGEVVFTFTDDKRAPAPVASVPSSAPTTPAVSADKLVVLRGAAKGAEFSVFGGKVLIGSDEDCPVRLRDEGVLGKHAILEQDGHAVWRLRSIDTARPIESDGKLVTELRIEHGITFNIGAAQLRFVTPRTAIESSPMAGTTFTDQAQAVAELNKAREALLAQVGSIIVGQHKALDQILVALFARGHCLLIGVPGLAKTLMVRALAGALDLDFKRIQFTPDLMPSDITGTDILEEDPITRARNFRFSRGPLFTNMLLADEINRTPPKTQAALLEAMQERRVTAAGLAYDLPQPFMVLATQNPIEQEGTYPLPEAQLDRFMFCVNINYPSAEEEQRVLLETTRDFSWEVSRVLHADDIMKFQHLVRQVPVSEHVALFATIIIRATRPGEPGAPDYISRWVRWGAGTRAGQCLLLAAKAHVLLSGRFSVSCADVREYALPVLRHRMFCNFAAASEGVTTDDIVKRILDHAKEPTY